MRALWIASGIGVWALHFALIYGFAALACARGFPQAIPWTIGAATLIAALLTLAIIARSYARRSDFVHWLTATLAALLLVAIVFEAVPLFWFPQCGRVW